MVKTKGVFFGTPEEVKVKFMEIPGKGAYIELPKTSNVLNIGSQATCPICEAEAKQKDLL